MSHGDFDARDRAVVAQAAFTEAGLLQKFLAARDLRKFFSGDAFAERHDQEDHE